MAHPWTSEQERQEYFAKESAKKVKKPRYIDANWLLKELEDNRPINWTDSEAEIQAQSDFDMFKHIIEYQPTADVVYVVRCKDCEYATKNTHGCYTCGIDLRITHEENSFCSNGERKHNHD